MTRTTTCAAVLAVGLLLGGCTLVPTSTVPDALAPHRVPFGLLGPSIPNTNNARVRFAAQPVYVIDASGHLTASSRIIPTPASLETVLRELVLGPTAIESAAGLTSALPRGLIILQATIKRGVAQVSLTTSLATLGRSDEMLAIAQLTYTAHAVGATSGLQILIAGVTQPLPIPGGANEGQVTVDNYRSLLNS